MSMWKLGFINFIYLFVTLYFLVVGGFALASFDTTNLPREVHLTCTYILQILMSVHLDSTTAIKEAYVSYLQTATPVVN